MTTIDTFHIQPLGGLLADSQLFGCEIKAPQGGARMDLRYTTASGVAPDCLPRSGSKNRLVRRWALVLAAFATLLLSGCGSSVPRVWVTANHARALAACQSQDCGPFSVTLRWSGVSTAGQTGYYVFLNGTQVVDQTASSYVYSGADCGTTFTLGVKAHNSSGGTSPMYSASYTTPLCSTLFSGAGGPYASEDRNWPGAKWVPYASTSPWNTELPAYTSATLDSSSASEINYMNAYWAHEFTPTAVSNTPANDQPSLWQHPVYWAKSTDPSYTIVDNDEPCVTPTSSFCPTTVRIPDGAEHATASDGHMTVIEPDGSEIDFWQVQNTNPLSGGGTITVSAYGELAGPGGSQTGGIDGPGCCGGANNIFTLPAGNIRAQELAAGVINHALAGSEMCSDGTNVPPDPAGISGGGTRCATSNLVGAQAFPRATITVGSDIVTFPNATDTLTITGVAGTVTCTGTNNGTDELTGCSGGSGTGADGAAVTGTNKGALPQGARIQLKMTDSQINALADCDGYGTCLPWEKTILIALAHYGMFMTDTGGNPMDMYFEPTIMYSSMGDTSHTVDSFIKAAAGGTLADPYTIEIALPWSDFQVVSTCYATNSC